MPPADTRRPRDFARHSGVQPRPPRGAGRRDRRHAVPQPPATAGSSTTRPTAAGGYRRHEMDRGPGQRVSGRRVEGRAPHALRAPARHPRRAPTTISAPTSETSARWSTWTSSNRAASTSASIPWAGERRVRDAIGERYGLNLEVVNHAVDATFRFMTVDWDGQIRMDPSSPCDGPDGGAQGSLRRRVRLRHGRGPARHRQPQPGVDGAEPLSLGGDRVPLRPPSRVAGGGGGGQDPRLERHDRPGRGAPRAPPHRGAGGIQVVRPGPDRRHHRLLRRGELGATFLRRDGGVWTTDKDGLVPDLLAPR